MTTTQQRPGTTARGGQAPEGAGFSRAPVLPAPRHRRRPALLALAVAMVVLGALGAAYLATSLGETTSVIAVAREVPQGQVITAAHLAEAQVPADPALSPIPFRDRGQIVGLLAATTLLPGSLLTADSVTAERLPPPGQHLVGIGVSAVQSPTTALHPGDQVLLVPVSDPATGTAPPVGGARAVRATVVTSGAPGPDGLRVVDVLVPAADSADIAARAAAGAVALVLVSAE